ncbi:MAG: exodeoxyribonuclease VII large subunit [Bryobacterales bacterium]|nr:exodeoxyribonuclease VII large subunit [Bryobacterales bacterium]
MSEFQPSFLFQPVERRYRVRELNREIADLLSVEFSDIWVEGEISDVKLSRPGHYYFALKDEDSVLNCVCFRNAARLLRFRPEEGLSVAARGRVDVYEVRGQYQFIVEALELRGQGALQLAFDQLKKKLESEGLFRPERKRPLPVLPRRIGIVTSPAGAALQDLLSVLERRFPGLQIRVYPTLVQGEAAPAQIATGLRFFSENPWADVVIVARGGGSLEDLWAFNTEVVARAIASSSVPVISAVGHETDFTIADFVADLRAPTPSAAAELVVPRREDLSRNLESTLAHLQRAYRLLLFGKIRKLQTLGTERAHATMQRRLRAATQRVDELEFRMRDAMRVHSRRAGRRFEQAHYRLMQFDLRVRMIRMRQALETDTQRLISAELDMLRTQRTRIDLLGARLHSMSPLAILNRGYSLAERNDGSLVRDSGLLQQGEAIRLRFARGAAIARIETTEVPPGAAE